MRKIPPWAYILGAVAIGGIYYLYKKSQEAKKAQEELAENKAEETPQPTVAGVENPLEEFPYSLSGLAGGGALGEAAESQNEFRELFTQQQHQSEEFEKGLSTEQQESQKAIDESLKSYQSSITEMINGLKNSSTGTIAQGSGGGAPTSNPGGTTTSPTTGGGSGAAGGGGTGGTPAPAGCSGAYPNSGPHGCYHDGKCSNGCEGHFYQNGTTECQVRVKGPKNAGHPKGEYCQWS